jgi:hypothetical protein
MVLLLALVTSAGIALRNHASQAAAGSTVSSANTVVVSANTSHVVPVIAAANAGTSTAAVSEVPAPPVGISQSPSASGTTASKTKSYEKIGLGSAALVNNVWGAPSGEVYNSSIYLSPDHTFGWSWTRLSPTVKSGENRVSPIFPSLLIGGTCFVRSQSAYFPIKLVDAKTLVLDVSYDYPQMPSGSYDLAYDLFLSDSAQPDINPKIAAEVMIWIDSIVKQPSKHYQGDFTDGTNTFALYSWTMADGRAYYSFVLKSSPALKGQYQIDAGKLLAQINLDSNWLIHGVEFGTEVYNGSGQIHISRFSVDLNGTEIIR